MSLPYPPPPPKKRRVIRTIVPERLADFDEQVWPVNLAILIFAGFTAGVVYAATDNFWDPRLLYNGFFRLALVLLLVAGLFWATALLRGRAARRVQFCVIISLLLHMILAVMLREQYLRLIARQEVEEAGIQEEERIVLPEYHRSPTDSEGSASEYDRPIPTPSPRESAESLQPSRVGPEAPAPDPSREPREVAEAPADPRAAPSPRVELTAPHRAETLFQRRERQEFVYQPQADQPVLASPVRPAPAPPAQQPQPSVSELARRAASGEFQPRTPPREPEDRPRPQLPEAGRPARSEQSPEVVATAPSARPAASRTPPSRTAAEAAPAAKIAATPAREIEAAPSSIQRTVTNDPVRGGASQEATAALEPAPSQATATIPLPRAEADSWQPAVEPAVSANASRARSTLAGASRAAEPLPAVAVQGGERSVAASPIAASSTPRSEADIPLRASTGSGPDRPEVSLSPQATGRGPSGEDRGVAPLSAGIPGQRSSQVTGNAGPALPVAQAESPQNVAASRSGRIDASPGEVSRVAGSPRLSTARDSSARAGTDTPQVALSVPTTTLGAAARRGEVAATQGALLSGEVGLSASGRVRVTAPGTPGMTARAEPAATEGGGSGGGGTPGGTGTQPNENALAVAGRGADPRVRGGFGGDSTLDVITGGRLGGSLGDQSSGIGAGVPDMRAGAQGSGDAGQGLPGGVGDSGVSSGIRRGLETASALSGTMAASPAEGIAGRSGGNSGESGLGTPTGRAGPQSGPALEIGYAGNGAGAPIRGGQAVDSAGSPHDVVKAMSGVFGVVTGPLRIPGGGDAEPMAALPVGSGPIRSGHLTPGLPANLGAAPAEEAQVAGTPGLGTGGGNDPRAMELAVDRREGGLAVLRPDVLGEGGVGGPPSPRVGLPGRFSRPESELVQDSGSRFATVRRAVPLPMTPGHSIPLEPAPAFMQRNPAQRGQHAAKFGGGPETEDAVERALAFLARLQFPDGHWSLHAVPNQAGLDPQAFAAGTMQGDTASTGLVLLAFLGAGYTHTDGKYQEVLQKALKWLVSRQQADGRLYSAAGDRNAFTRFYGHGLASIALCEAYGMTRDPVLREAGEKAVAFIARSQHPQYGGWRYEPQRESDTSVTGWQLMALKSAEMAGLDVPRPVLEKVAHWLDLAQAEGGARYMYNPHAGETPSQLHGRLPNRAMTAEGLLMRIYLGWDHQHPPLVQGSTFLRGQLPDFGTPQNRLRDAYYWYYATQVMFQMQGDYWRDWNARIRPLLLESQIREGDLAGSWDPRQPIPDRWAEQAGRLYVTAVHTLILEVYYRHLPLFKSLAERP